MCDLSVVIPVRNEEGILSELTERLGKTLSQMKLAYEIIFVTDVNSDQTYDELLKMNKTDNKIKVIKLTRSYGQHVAVLAGLHNCSGQAVAIMDGDLQDYPEDVPKLYAKMQGGYDIVYGKKSNKDDSYFKNVLSKMFVKVLNLLSDVRIEYNTSMFRIISKRALTELLKYKEKDPSLTFIMNVIGFPEATVEVTSGKRLKGKTNYGLGRLINLSITSLIAFTTKPLRIISLIGMIISSLSFLYFFNILIKGLIYKAGVLGWPTVVCLLTFLGGVQLLSLGVIGEYVARIFIETKNRPLYTIEESYGEFK